MPKKTKIGRTDLIHYKMIRKNVSNFIRKAGKKYDKKGLLLDIAPQIHEGASPYFKTIKVLILDIDEKAKADYTADICKNNKKLIPNNYFDFVVCTEVLEHVLNPFAAVMEIERVLKPKGLVFISTPFNFRIHGPSPDCWRFTEHGLRVLLSNFKIIKLQALETKNRPFMPVHYTVIAQKVKYFWVRETSSSGD